MLWLGNEGDGFPTLKKQFDTVILPCDATDVLQLTEWERHIKQLSLKVKDCIQLDGKYVSKIVVVNWLLPIVFHRTATSVVVTNHVTPCLVQCFIPGDSCQLHGYLACANKQKIFQKNAIFSALLKNVGHYNINK